MGHAWAPPWPGRPAHRKARIDKLCFFTSFETRLWPQVGCLWMTAYRKPSGTLQSPHWAGYSPKSVHQPNPKTARPCSGMSAWAERLRKVTIKAPLQSLFVAFLLGMWVARRR